MQKLCIDCKCIDIVNFYHLCIRIGKCVYLSQWINANSAKLILEVRPKIMCFVVLFKGRRKAMKHGTEPFQ